ncbi:MAG: ATP phosphoribosyltransferase [Gammaproteobacteria bacterium]|jgi:ATP phosphoribosyltransferase
MNDPKLVIALTKGRILQEVLPLFEKAGIVPAEDIFNSRKLIFPTNLENVSLMIIRGSDVPTYVEFGSADMGVVGKDLILEYGGEGFYEPLDLKLANCRLMTAAPEGRDLDVLWRSRSRLRVATKFINIARRYFAEQGRQIELIKLNGALELAPSLGLADAIVDIVDSGKTLKANGLEALDLITHVSSRVIVNKASLKIKNAAIREILGKLKAAVDS